MPSLHVCSPGPLIFQDVWPPRLTLVKECTCARVGCGPLQFLAASAALGHVTVRGPAVEVQGPVAGSLTPSSSTPRADGSPRRGVSTGSPEFVHLLRSRVSSASFEFTVGLDGSMTLLRCRWVAGGGGCPLSSCMRVCVC